MSAPIPVARPLLPRAAAIAPYLARIDGARVYSNFGPLARELEARLAARHDLPAANVATAANATLALTLALIAAGARPGGYCAMPSWTFFATPHAARMAGLVPYFVDVDPVSWALTPAHVDALPAEVKSRLSAAMPVWPFGAAGDVDAWDRWSDARGLPVVIDAAASFDALVPGRAPAVVSLHATKVLGAGEGAYVVSRDAARVAAIRSASGFGLDLDRIVRAAGTNAKLSEYAAAVALAALDAWPDTRARWRAARRAWVDALSSADAFFPFGANDPPASATLIARLNTDVAGVARELAARGIDTRRWWNAGCAAEPGFAEYPRASLPVTEALARRTLGLPMAVDLAPTDIARAADAVRPYLATR
jgi:dTDP-4-amino-4,6-dideoxygalactose transaminase